MNSPAAGSGSVNGSGEPPVDGTRDKRRSSLGKEDAPVFGPASAAAVGSIAERDHGAARDGDLLQLAAGEEADRLPVGREERVARAFGSGQRRSLQLIEPAHVELRAGVRCLLATKASTAAVGGEDRRRALRAGGQRRLRPQLDAQSQGDRRLRLSPGRPQHERLRQCQDSRQRLPRERRAAEGAAHLKATRPRRRPGPRSVPRRAPRARRRCRAGGSSGCARGSGAAFAGPKAASRPAARSIAARASAPRRVRPRRSRRRRAACPSASRTARRRTTRCRRACPPACRGPARATCRRPCRGSALPRSRSERELETLTNWSCRWCRRDRCSRPWRGRSRGP